MAHELKHEGFGVAGTAGMDSNYGQGMGVLNTLGGSAEAGQQAMEFARQLYPDTPKADPWEAAFQFFAEMGKQASQPGATVLGSAVGSMQVPLDYLNAKKKELAETKRARMTAAVQLAPNLKADAGKITYRPATAAELLKYGGATAGQMGSDGKFYDLSAKTGSGTTNTGSYVFQNTAAFERFKIEFPGIAETLTEGQITGTEPLIINKSLLTNPKLPNVFKEPPSSSGDDAGPNSALSKLYKDLEDATEGGPEALALQSQIDALITKSGFDKEIFDAENEILTSYNKATKSIKESRINYAKMEEAVKSADGPGDLALVFSFMKMLDPGSVVRESEFSAAQNTAGLFQKLEVAAENIKKGDLLSPKQRQSFLALSKKFLEGGNNYMIKIRRDKGIQANNYGLNAANIFGYEPAPAEWYISEEAYEIAEAAGTTVEAAWLNKNDAEQAEWIAENGGS